MTRLKKMTAEDFPKVLRALELGGGRRSRRVLPAAQVQLTVLGVQRKFRTAVQGPFNRVERKNETKTELGFTGEHRFVTTVAGVVAQASKRNRVACICLKSLDDAFIVQEDGMSSATQKRRSGRFED